MDRAIIAVLVGTIGSASRMTSADSTAPSLEVMQTTSSARNTRKSIRERAVSRVNQTEILNLKPSVMETCSTLYLICWYDAPIVSSFQDCLATQLLDITTQ